MNAVFEGVVVREAPLGENGKTLYVLTAENGVVRIDAKGARKISASYLKSAQLFAYSKLTVYDKNSHYTLTEAELISGFYNIRKDIGYLSVASYACETSYLAASSDDGMLLKLLLNTLYAASEGISEPDILKAVFEFEFCRVCGFLPEICCADCESPVCGFDFGELSFFCGEHLASSPRTVRFINDMNGLLRFLSSCPLGKMLSFKADADTVGEFCVFAERLLTETADIRPKSLDFCKEILKK